VNVLAGVLAHDALDDVAGLVVPEPALGLFADPLQTGCLIPELDALAPEVEELVLDDVGVGPLVGRQPLRCVDLHGTR